MNFQKIYAEFETARAKQDFEKMSEIIAQLNYNYAEIPSNIFNEFFSYVDVMVYQAMKFLSNGNATKSKFYFMSLTQLGSSLDSFFYLYYLIGRAFYLTGDYLHAIKFFLRYEKIRTNIWKDNDEINLFYLANSLAFMKDFQMAAQLYERILNIKANFPEAKKNLKLVQSGTNKNLVREIKSLWKFSGWRDVPIFINARDRLGVMKRLIDWLLNAGYRNLIILDNNSTYPPLLEYYSALEKDSRVKIVRLGENLGYKALWQSGILEKLKISTPYVYTDPDVLPIERCPKNFVKRLMEILDANHELRKVGLGLIFEDLTFFNAAGVQNCELKFYKGSQVGENLYYAQVDTTFALYSNVRHYNLRFSLRTTGNLMLYHLPWYFDYGNLPEDEKYYIEHADHSSTMARVVKGE